MTTAPPTTLRGLPFDRATTAVGLCGVFLAAFFPLHRELVGESRWDGALLSFRTP